ncbi:MAG: hypothetical protein IJB17_01915 [Oscillospiraceae bacterium]|nr:hypothetical protein [Oscillospiraceae bacterium]
MDCLGRDKLQMGEAGFFLGDLPHLFKGAIELEMYACPQCGKMEFYRPVFTKGELDGYSHHDLPQKQCPKCGETHDFDYPKCPYCNFNYYG